MQGETTSSTIYGCCTKAQPVRPRDCCRASGRGLSIVPIRNVAHDKAHTWITEWSDAAHQLADETCGHDFPGRKSVTLMHRRRHRTGEYAEPRRCPEHIVLIKRVEPFDRPSSVQRDPRPESSGAWKPDPNPAEDSARRPAPVRPPEH